MATEFNEAFLERRMAEHRRWQHEIEYALVEEIIDEVQALPKRTPKTGRLFLDLPESLRLGDEPIAKRRSHRAKNERRGTLSPAPLPDGLASASSSPNNVDGNSIALQALERHA